MRVILAVQVIGMGYPGLFAPASLKHIRGDRSVLHAAELLSGAFCSGLIEAGEVDFDRRRVRELSGAFCSGLIEASRRRRRAAASRRVIRGFLLRPH